MVGTAGVSPCQPSRARARWPSLDFRAFVTSPVGAQTSQTGKPKANASEIATLEKAAVFEINPNSGSLKESVQKGQELIWHRKENPNDVRFKLTNISLALLRSEAGGQVKITFSCNISSLGYLTPDEAKLNILIRATSQSAINSACTAVGLRTRGRIGRADHFCSFATGTMRSLLSSARRKS